MFQLACSVRNCGQLLQQSGAGLECPARHRFDRAKQGYYNLLQPQDSRSAKPGDHDDAVLARERWLARGHMAGLVNALRPWCETPLHSDAAQVRTLDLGCGEGTFGHLLFGDSSSSFCGIDLSQRAIRLAARKWPDATWVQANADRQLPAVDASTHRVLSLFGRRPTQEIKRILAPGGICIVAVPAADDLVELREHVQTEGTQRNRWQPIAQQFAEAGFALVDQATWTHRVELDRAGIADALAMTYRAVRYSQRQRLETLESAIVTLAADLMLFQHADR